MGPSLSRDAILECPDANIVPVEVPEWGGVVYVKELTAEERSRYDILLFKDGKVDTDNYYARLCVFCVTDEHGNRIFSDDDAVPLGRKSSGAVGRVFDVARKLNRIGAEEVADLEKN